MNKMYIAIILSCLSGCSTIPRGSTKDPISYVKENESKISYLREDEIKHWDLVIDQVYSAPNLEELDRLDKNISDCNCGEVGYTGYARAKIAVLYQRVYLTNWKK